MVAPDIDRQATGGLGLMPIEFNSLETTRFGVVAAHVAETGADIEAINAAADDLGVEMLTARIEVGDLPTVHRFESAGFRLMDTIVYYGRATTNLPERLNYHETSIRLARHDDSSAVGAIARRAFRGYVGHFHADPHLDRDAADAVYVEWAETSTAHADKSRPVLLCCRNNFVLGFLTLRGIGEQTAEIVLNAVDPMQQGRGIYGLLVESALKHARQGGANELSVSTQINNYGVQRVWARLGFVHTNSLYTFHKWYQRTN